MLDFKKFYGLFKQLTITFDSELPGGYSLRKSFVFLQEKISLCSFIAGFINYSDKPNKNKSFFVLQLFLVTRFVFKKWLQNDTSTLLSPE